METQKKYNSKNETKQKSKVAVIIPCYNAGERLGKVIQSLTQYCVDIFVVDDGSTDDCIEQVLNMPVSIISFPENRGKGFAIIEGLKHVLKFSEYESVCFMDADGQHDPQLLPLFIKEWEDSKVDMIIGQRNFQPKMTPLPSKMGNFITQYLLRVLIKCPLKDTQCGFRLYSRSFAEDIVKIVPPGRYETETWILLFALKKRKKIVPLPISSIYEEKNRSSHFRKIYDSMRILKAILYFIVFNRL